MTSSRGAASPNLGREKSNQYYKMTVDSTYFPSFMLDTASFCSSLQRNAWKYSEYSSWNTKHFIIRSSLVVGH